MRQERENRGLPQLSERNEKERNEKERRGSERKIENDGIGCAG